VIRLKTELGLARAVVALGMLVTAAPQGLPAAPEAVPEYRVKLVYLYNFARFATWPARAFDSPEAPFDIGVLDLAPFENALPVIEGKRAGGRPVRVRLCRTIGEMKQCHLLFVNRGDDLYVKALLTALQDAPVLTISEHPAFTRWGGAMRFFHEKQRIRFAVNRHAAHRAGIRLSAQLLQVAEIEDREVVK
jgi:hypothetical protein